VEETLENQEEMLICQRSGEGQGIAMSLEAQRGGWGESTLSPSRGAVTEGTAGVLA
jgi:hypothetical protein